MAKVEKFKFRREKAETGLRAVTSRPSTRIKIGKMVCGRIVPPSWDSDSSYFKIKFNYLNENGELKSTTLTKQVDSEEAAREWLSKPEIFKAINDKFKLFLEEDDYSDKN